MIGAAGIVTRSLCSVTFPRKSNFSLSAGMHRQAMRYELRRSNDILWAPRPVAIIRSASGIRHLRPIPFDTANLKFQFVSPFYSTPPSMSFRGRAAPVGISRYNLNVISAPKSVGNLQIVQWTDTFLAYLIALREIATSAPSGPPRNDITGKVCPINSNLTVAETNREGPMVCRRLPACQARIACRGIPANSNLNCLTIILCVI